MQTGPSQRGRFQSIVRWREEARGPGKENETCRDVAPSGRQPSTRGDDRPELQARRPWAALTMLSDGLQHRWRRSDARQFRDRRWQGYLVGSETTPLLLQTKPENLQDGYAQKTGKAGSSGQIKLPKNPDRCCVLSNASRRDIRPSAGIVNRSLAAGGNGCRAGFPTRALSSEMSAFGP
jgi:hypothetical protein